MLSHIGYIRGHGYKSHDTEKDVEGFGKIMLYNICNTWLFRVG